MMTNKAIEYDLPKLKEKSSAECAHLLYEIAVNGEEIERQIKDFLLSEYSLASVYQREQWFIADRTEGDYGKPIHNPDTQGGGFPDLTSLLKWCIKNRNV